MEDKKNEGRK